MVHLIFLSFALGCVIAGLALLVFSHTDDRKANRQIKLFVFLLSVVFTLLLTFMFRESEACGVTGVVERGFTDTPKRGFDTSKRGSVDTPNRGSVDTVYVYVF